MNRTAALPASQACVLILALVGLGASAGAQSVQHLTLTQPGGMPGLPVMTGIEQTTNGVSVSWDGPSGYYQVLEKTALKDPTWLAVGKPTNLVRRATITTLYSNAFFRVSGPAPQYAGAQACAGCHTTVHDAEMNTPHAHALEALQQINQGANPACLACHTVGYGLPTGFAVTNRNGVFSYTTNLAGVQCENCHGPAANHAANPDDPTVIPRIEIAATVCGGCHTDSQHPTFDEWNSSEHAGVVEDLNPANRIDSCGRCHSGSVRLSLLKNKPLPAGDANIGIVCVTCHDPHQTNSNPVQLRNPVSSTNNYFITTSGTLTSQYNPNINLCAQCHNHRGASWTANDRAPHHSLQYNFLLGSIGELATGSATFRPASHAGLPESAAFSIPPGSFYLTNQCVSCHMQDNAAPASIASHTFTVDTYDVCLNCHPFDPGYLVSNVAEPAISNRVYRLKYALDQWAASTNAPAYLRTNGAPAWEYTNPGGLVWRTNSSGGILGWILADQVTGKGPDAFGQTNGIPVNIRKARFNLYLVLGDGSYGVHNPFFATDLLEAAATWVSESTP